MDNVLDRLGESPIAGIFSVIMVWAGLALGPVSGSLDHAREYSTLMLIVLVIFGIGIVSMYRNDQRITATAPA